MTNIHTSSEEETAEAGRSFASELRTGDVVLIEGPLGAGKTAFVRGIAEGLGADPSDVSSPTFTILQQYRSTPILYHADLYRLTAAEVPDLGLEETGLDGVLAIEWPDRWAARPRSAIQVVIEDLGGADRQISVRRYSTL
ncbi:MAG TPA: tRNA (adenosine(37)-N6)-threonylcarbamoyltransferase complex ATPase subunit type 1 TsaE [Vicinamibacterales bacterium]|nr:tRNA (adenosine(37)-N6)-threonylcarbamoyltransferase complex ATPase subunit type 1 TsaE [Vicinamibacterales bacterium]